MDTCLEIQRRLGGLLKEFVVADFAIIARSFEMSGVIERHVALLGVEDKLLRRFRLGDQDKAAQQAGQNERCDQITHIGIIA
jgi:hypothetical protein